MPLQIFFCKDHSFRFVIAVGYHRHEMFGYVEADEVVETDAVIVGDHADCSEIRHLHAALQVAVECTGHVEHICGVSLAHVVEMTEQSDVLSDVLLRLVHTFV